MATTPGPAFAFGSATVGGTFQAMHAGHRRYLDIAFLVASFVHVSVTSRAYAASLKQYEVKPYDVRRGYLQEYFDAHGWDGRYEIHEIQGEVDLEGFVTTTDIDVAVVEPRYFSRFQELSFRRSRAGQPELCIILKPRTLVAGEDLSSSAIELGAPVER